MCSISGRFYQPRILPVPCRSARLAFCAWIGVLALALFPLCGGNFRVRTNRRCGSARTSPAQTRHLIAPRRDPDGVKAGSASVVRTALIGFGRVAELHYVPALRALPNVRIVAVADPLVARQDAARAAFGDVKVFPCADILLATHAVDAVLIASPPATHFAIVEAAVQREVAVFVEKPFVGPGEVALLKRVSRTDRLMIDFNRRFWPGYQHLRTLVANSRRTDPIWMRVVMQVDSQRWNSIARISERGGEGGVLYDLGSHAIDLALFITGGEPISVRARSTTPTACSLKVRLRDGSTAACFVRYDRRAVERIE